VFPFENASDNPDAEYLSDDITDSVIRNLSQLPNLRVMARTTVFRFKDSTDPQQAGRELGVGAIVTGRIEQRGDTLIARAEMMDVATGTQLWGERYDRRMADVLTHTNGIPSFYCTSVGMRKLCPRRSSLWSWIHFHSPSTSI
jgi:TolB-like protein